MDQPQNADNPNGPNTNLAPPEGIRRPLTEEVQGNRVTPQQQTIGADENGNPHNWFNDLWGKGADRHIELILAGAIAFFACCQLIVTCNNNRSTSQQVDKLIGAATQIQTAAGSFSTSAADINTGVGNAVVKLQGQVDQIRRSANASARQVQSTNASVQVSKDSMYLEQRPWVGIEVIPASIASSIVHSAQDFKVGGVVMVAHNSGRMPALEWQSRCCETLDRMQDGPVPDYDTLHADIDRHISRGAREMIALKKETIDEAREFARQLLAEEDSSQGSQVIAPGQYREVSNIVQISGNGIGFHYILGKFTYRDALNRTKEHTTKFCLLHVGNSPLELCRTGQGME
jgi:hypothetical protein